MPSHQVRIQRKENNELTSEFQQGYRRALDDLHNGHRPTVAVYKRDDSISFPKYQTNGAVAFDLAARVSGCIKPGTVELICTGLVLKPEAGYWIMIAGRSSLHRRHLMLANNVGIVDPDYCGPSDEIKLAIWNFGSEEVEINAGDRLAQAIVLPHCQADIVPFVPEDDSRGGFGSTGQ